MGRFITDIVSIPFSNNFSIIFFRYDCDDREAEDDELNGNDEDEESGEEAPENEDGIVLIHISSLTFVNI